MKFSIGVPAFKAKYLNECIASILSQTFNDFELIVVNDASPENIAEIIQNFDDKRLKYLTNEKNFGALNVVDNWNKCLSFAQGDYFVLMGDDDKMEPNYLEEFAKLILKYPNLDIFHCRSKIINANSIPIKLTPSWPEYETVYENLWHRIEGYRINYISDFVYRISTLKENGGFYFLPLAWGSDDVTAYIAIGTKGIAHINIPLLNYRSHPTSISSTGNSELKMEAIMQKQKWFNEFLLVKPHLPNDLIIYNDIGKNLSKVIQKEKILTISSSLNGHFLKNILIYINKRKKYNISATEIIYSIIDFMKMKMVRKKFNPNSFN